MNTKKDRNWGLGLIPSGALSRINREWDQWFDSVFGDWNSWFPRTNYPVNVVVEKDEHGIVTHDIIEVALAGIDKDKIKVSVSYSCKVNYLNIIVDQQKEDRDARYKGTTSRSFRASYALSDNHDESKIECEFTNGLLKVKVPLKTLDDYKASLKTLEIPIK